MDESVEKKVPKKEHDAIIQEATDRLKMWDDIMGDNLRESVDDLKFALLGEQWESDMLKDRTGRPCLTVNKLKQYIDQVVNEQRQAKQAIKVVGVDSKSDREVARIETGLIRNIEYLSRADLAYETAYLHGVTGGIGYFGIVTEYAGPDTFDQDIKVRTFENMMAVKLDCHSSMPDGSDANWAFVEDTLSKEEFEEEYGEYNESDVPDSYAGAWHDKNNRYLREYWKRSRVKVKLSLWSDGVTRREDEPAPIDPSVTVVREREAHEHKVKMYKLAGDRVLSESEFPSQYIPIFPVYGNRVNIEGKVHIYGIVRQAKDPQRMFNWWRTAMAERIALVPKAPYLVTGKQIEGYEGIWDNANKDPYAYLPYNADPKAPGAPQRAIMGDDVSGIVAANMQSEEDIKASVGIYDPQLGVNTGQSGRAILALQKQGDTSTFNYADNLSRSKAQAGRVIVELIGKLYDTERIVRVMGEDGEASLEVLNKRVPIPGGAMQVLNDVTLGKYDVEVTTGPSFATKRMEATQAMLDFMQAFPPSGPVIGPKLAKLQDWEGAEELAQELAALNPKPDSPQMMVQQIAQQAEQTVMTMRGQFEEQIKKLQEDKAIEWAKLDLEKEKVEISKDKLEFDKMKASLDAAADDARVQEIAVSVLANYLQAAEIEAQEELAEELNDAVEEQLQQTIGFEEPIDESNVTLQNDTMATGAFPGESVE